VIIRTRGLFGGPEISPGVLMITVWAAATPATDRPTGRFRRLPVVTQLHTRQVLGAEILPPVQLGNQRPVPGGVPRWGCGGLFGFGL
jgi:hypothetical protein